MNSEFVLYEGRVYSTNPRDNFFGPDPLSIIENRYSRDEDRYPPLLNKNGGLNKLPKLSKPTIFVFDKQETEVRNHYLKVIKNNSLNLAQSRKVIVDEKYPVYVEYTRKFKRWTMKRKMALMLGNYSIIFGRECLVDMISSCRYEQAWPEIREIIFHDTNRRMKLSAISALSNFSLNISIPIYVEMLNTFEKDFWIYKTLDAIEYTPHVLFVDELEKLFEKYFYYHPEDYSHIHYKATFQQKILEICGRIPSVKALRVLEKGVSHPFSHVEIAALVGILSWAKNMSYFVSTGKYSQTDSFRIEKIIKETLWKYDLRIGSSKIPGGVTKKDVWKFYI